MKSLAVVLFNIVATTTAFAAPQYVWLCQSRADDEGKEKVDCEHAILESKESVVAGENLIAKITYRKINRDPVVVNNPLCSFDQVDRYLRDSSGNAVYIDNLRVAASVIKSTSNGVKISASSRLTSTAILETQLKLEIYDQPADFFKDFIEWRIITKPALFGTIKVRNDSWSAVSDKSCIENTILSEAQQ